MTISRSLQWIGATLVLLVLVGLNYDFDSKAGMRMNAPLDDPLSQSLRGYWKMDEGTGTSTTADSSGNANTLSMTGPPTWTTGTIGPSALDFSGSGQYLSIASPSSVLDFAAGTNFTLTGWFNRDLFGADHTILSSKSAQTTSDGYIIWIDNNAGNDYLNFRADENGSADAYSLISTTNLSATGWHHFAVSWNESAPDAILYIDGAVDGAASGTAFASMGDLSNANPFSIGAETDGGNPFDGKLDDIRVYGYALSAGEVTKLYQTTAPTQPVDTGLVGHWTFDGPDIQGTTAIDRSSFGNSGTITGAVPAKGKLGQGLRFDGTGDSVALNYSTVNFEKTNTFSISAWIKTTTPGFSNYQTIFIHQTNDASETGYDFLVTPSSTIYYNTSALGAWFHDSYGNSLTVSSPTNSIASDIWYHIVMTYNGSAVASGIQFYINGTAQTMSVFTNQGLGGPTMQSTANAYIGSWHDGGGSFIGTIDDVRAYNRVLSANEISNLYILGR